MSNKIWQRKHTLIMNIGKLRRIRLSKMRHIGIMVPEGCNSRRELKLYLRYSTSKMKLFCFSLSSIDWEKQCILAMHRSGGRWHRRKFPFPDVVYNRCYNRDVETISRLEAIIGENTCFNHINQLDKFEIYLRLIGSLSHYLPETQLYESKQAEHMLRKHGVIYIKPCHGHQGIGVYRIEKMPLSDIQIGQHYFAPEIITEDMESFKLHSEKQFGSQPCIMQQGIHMKNFNGQCFDIRVFLQKNGKGLWSVHSLISRVAYKNSFNTSICDKLLLTRDLLNRLYPAKKVKAILHSIQDISISAAKIISAADGWHMGELSVDFTLDQEDRLWIIELNGKPQKKIYHHMRGHFLVYKRPLQYANYLCKINKS